VSKIFITGLITIIFCLSGFAIAGAQGTETVYSTKAGSFEFGLKAGLALTKMPENKTGISNFYEEGEFFDDFTADSKFHKGFQHGIFVVYHINNKFSFQMELLHVLKGVEVENKGHSRVDSIDTDYNLTETEKISISYLEIPFFIKYQIPTGDSYIPSLYAGGALSFKMSVENYIDYDFSVYENDVLVYQEILEGNPDIDNIKSTDFSLVFGGDVGIKVGNHKLLFDLRYTMGLMDVFEDVDPETIPSVTEYFPREYPVVNTVDGKAPSMKNSSISLTVGLLF